MHSSRERWGRGKPIGLGATNPTIPQSRAICAIASVLDCVRAYVYAANQCSENVGTIDNPIGQGCISAVPLFVFLIHVVLVLSWQGPLGGTSNSVVLGGD